MIVGGVGGGDGLLCGSTLIPECLHQIIALVFSLLHLTAIGVGGGGWLLKCATLGFGAVSGGLVPQYTLLL